MIEGASPEKKLSCTMKLLGFRLPPMLGTFPERRLLLRNSL